MERASGIIYGGKFISGNNSCAIHEDDKVGKVFIRGGSYFLKNGSVSDVGTWVDDGYSQNMTTGVVSHEHNYVDGVCSICGEKEEAKIEVPVVDPDKPVENTEVGASEKAVEGISNAVDKIVDGVKKGEVSSSIDEQTYENCRAAVESGKTVTVAIEVKEEKNPPFEDKELVEKELTKSDAQAASFFDLSVVLKANGQAIGKITKLDTEVEFVIAVPKALIKEGRKFYVIRVHEGKAEILPTTMKADGTIVFKTDRFSTYALGYNDAAVPVETPKPTQEPTPTPVPVVPDMPQTGDNSSLMLWATVLLVAVAALAGVALFVRKNGRGRA